MTPALIVSPVLVLHGIIGAQEKKYCGLNGLGVTFRTPPAVNAACERHDRAYGRVPGLGKYVTGLRSRTIRETDRRLVRAVRKAPRTTYMSVSDRRKARAIETFFRAKEGVNHGAGNVRGSASAIGRHASRLSRSAARRVAAGWSRTRLAARARLHGLRLLQSSRSKWQ